MPNESEINDKVLIHDVKITNLENDMKEVKGEIKNLNDVWRTIDSLTTNLNALSEVANRLSIDTNKSIQEVSELIKAQSLEFKESQKITSENLKKHESIINDIKNKPAYDALSQKQWLGKQIAQKLILFLFTLIVLGYSFYTYSQNQKLQQQIIEITNQN